MKIIRNFSSFQLITLGFLTVILLGSLLLMLPGATADREGATFADALFTATSATCVTGLIVQNTATYWSAFGQMVILGLIQIGGMGVVTIAVAFSILSGRKIGLMERSTMQEAISAPSIGGIVRMTGFIVRGIAAIELLGILLLLPAFVNEYGWGKGIWYAVFHSVSAFCNAGFDLLGMRIPYISLVEYTDRPLVLITIGMLIIIGGIGFMTWEDVRVHKYHVRRYRLQSKVILITTILLIVLPAWFFWRFEFSQPDWHGLTQGEKVLAACFQAVTPRTAGFNSVDLSRFSEAGQMVITVLMLIGGAPGSTAGGMKVTTLAVVVCTAGSVFHRRDSVQCFQRRISGEVVKNAVAVFLMYLTLCFLGGIMISMAEGLSMLTCLFEAASAIGTVGLSLGITPQLGQLSRAVLILLMFTGRVGGMTLVFTALYKKKVAAFKLPGEKIMVG